MCKYLIVKSVIARQDVDGHFGTTLNLPAGLLSTYYVCQYTRKLINQLLPIIGRQLTGDKNFVSVQHYYHYGRNSNMVPSVTMYMIGYIILTYNRDTLNRLLLHHLV